MFPDEFEVDVFDEDDEVERMEDAERFVLNKGFILAVQL